MNTPFPALAVAATLAIALAGCSDSDGDDPAPDAPDTSSPPVTDGGGGTDGEQTFTPRPSRPDGPRGAGAPTGDTKAGNYVGSLGFGDADSTSSVYVIDDNNQFYGLTLDRDDSSARSFFGDVGDGNMFNGTFRTYTHNASNPPSAGGFGTGPTSQQVEQSTDGEFVTGEYTMSFVPGQTIVATDAEGNENTLVFAEETGQISPASAEGVAGAWRGVNEFGDCSGGGDCRLVFDVTFDGATLSGTTSVQNGAGDRSRENALSGEVSEYGTTLLLTFSWEESAAVTSTYVGAAFFADDTDRLVFLGETDDERAGLPVLASLLERQP